MAPQLRMHILLLLGLAGVGCRTAQPSSKACQRSGASQEPVVMGATVATEMSVANGTLVVLAADACDSRPLHGAGASLRRADGFAMQENTDAAGRTVLVAGTGPYEFRLRLFGYAPASARVELRAGHVDTIRVDMWPDGSVIAATPPRIGCPTADSAVFEGTRLAARDGWYGKQLRALGARGLCADGDSTRERFRVTFIPTFHPAVVVTLDHRAGLPRLAATVLSGAGGYDPGVIARDTSITLSEQEWESLAKAMRATELWSEPLRRQDAGLDGSQWIFEGVRDGRYNVVDLWSPRRRGDFSRYRRAGEQLMRRAGIVDMDIVRQY